jgi:hypothetical protein
MRMLQEETVPIILIYEFWQTSSLSNAFPHRSSRFSLPSFFGFATNKRESDGDFDGDIDTKEKPMELPEDHPDAAGDSDEDLKCLENDDNPGAARGDDAEDGDDDPAAPDGGDEDLDDDLEPVEWSTTSTLMMCPGKLWTRTSEAARRALYYLYHAYQDELQGTEFQQFPHRRKGATSAQIPIPPPGEGSLLMDTTQELVATLSTDLDAVRAEIQEARGS